MQQELKSHPTGVRGLKLEAKQLVAPHRGAWIETRDAEYYFRVQDGRTPQGCVD